VKAGEKKENAKMSALAETRNRRPQLKTSQRSERNAGTAGSKGRRHLQPGWRRAKMAAGASE